MYLFSRVRTAKVSRIRDARAWAATMRDLAADRTGIDVTLHSSVFGRPAGTFTWAALVEGRAALATMMGKLVDDDEYLDHVERSGEMFHGNPEDSFRLILQLDGIDTDGPAPMVSQAWSAQIANGQLDHATDWGTDIATYVYEVTGAPIVTMADAYGDFGRMTWIAAMDSPEHADRVNELLAQDPEYVKRVNYAEDLFIPGSGRMWLNQRVA